MVSSHTERGSKEAPEHAYDEAPEHISDHGEVDVAIYEHGIDIGSSSGATMLRRRSPLSQGRLLGYFVGGRHFAKRISGLLRLLRRGARGGRRQPRGGRRWVGLSQEGLLGYVGEELGQEVGDPGFGTGGRPAMQGVASRVRRGHHVSGEGGRAASSGTAPAA